MPDTEKLTWDEIKKRYPEEWVVLVDFDPGKFSADIAAGRVCSHAKSRKDALANLKDGGADNHWAIRFTGEVGKGRYLF